MRYFSPRGRYRQSRGLRWLNIFQHAMVVRWSEFFAGNWGSRVPIWRPYRVRWLGWNRPPKISRSFLKPSLQEPLSSLPLLLFRPLSSQQSAMSSALPAFSFNVQPPRIGVPRPIGMDSDNRCFAGQRLEWEWCMELYIGIPWPNELSRNGRKRNMLLESNWLRRQKQNINDGNIHRINQVDPLSFELIGSGNRLEWSEKCGGGTWETRCGKMRLILSRRSLYTNTKLFKSLDQWEFSSISLFVSRISRDFITSVRLFQFPSTIWPIRQALFTAQKIIQHLPCDRAISHQSTPRLSDSLNGPLKHWFWRTSVIMLHIRF